MSPEVLSDGPVESIFGSDDQRRAGTCPSGPKSDTWSLGMILLELCQVTLDITHYLNQNTCFNIFSLHTCIIHNLCSFHSFRGHHSGQT